MTKEPEISDMEKRLLAIRRSAQSTMAHNIGIILQYGVDDLYYPHKVLISFHAAIASPDSRTALEGQHVGSASIPPHFFPKSPPLS